MADNAQTTRRCTHPARKYGERMPLAYGSARVQHCVDCGAWRYDLHGWSSWSPQSTLAAAMEEDDGR